MKARIEKVSAITLHVGDMENSVRFYREMLGLEIIYGGPNAEFTSLRIPGAEFPLINLQQGRPTADWGRIIFYVSDVDFFWADLKQKGFEPKNPRDAAWGERYFHMHDPDGYELSFARPLHLGTHD